MKSVLYYLNHKLLILPWQQLNIDLKTYHQKHRIGSALWCLKACKMHRLRSLLRLCTEWMLPQSQKHCPGTMRTILKSFHDQTSKMQKGDMQ